MNDNIIENVRKQLLENADNKYKTFSSSLIPNIDNVLGVRLPTLRKIAKEIYKNNQWKEFLNQNSLKYMEEIMLQGMVIGLLDLPISECLKYVENFVPKINNWSVCDSFCCGLKFVEKNKNAVWSCIQPYFTSENEFEIRFAFVILLNFFIVENYVDNCIKLIDEFKNDKYYAQMAVAWCLSICYIKFPEKTLEYLKKSNLDNWTFNKSIQKICESLRVDKDTKNMLKYLRRKV